MALTKSSVTRTPDPAAGADLLRTFTDGTGEKAQGVVLVDDNGDQIGIASNPAVAEWSASQRLIALSGNREAIAFGLDGDFLTGRKFGKTDTGDVGTAYTTIAYKTPAFEQPVYASGTAEFVYVESASAQDSVAGTGLRSGWIQGVDETLKYVVEQITLAGLTPVKSTKKYLYLLRWFPEPDTGSSETQAGEITIKDLAGTTTYMVISTEDAGSQVCYFGVPPGMICVVLDAKVQLSSGKAGNVRLQVRHWEDSPPYTNKSPWRTLDEFRVPADSPPFQVRYVGPESINGPAELRLQAKVDSTTGEAIGSFGIQVLDTAP